MHSATNNNGFAGGGPACYGVNAATGNMDVCALGATSCSSNQGGDTNWSARVLILCM